MKKYYIGLDMEGVACVVGTPGKGLEGVNYAFAAHEGLEEANACARALFDSGADEVILWDNHSTGVNLDYERVDPRCRIALGSGFGSRFPAIDDSFAGVIFIGYHAREATRNAVLSHTYSSVTYQDYEVNGVSVGEMEIDAAFAALHHVPPILAVSDLACVRQAKESFPGIRTVATKEGFGWNAAISLSPQAAREAVYKATLDAVAHEKEMRPYSMNGPLQVRIRYKRMDAANSARLFDMNGRPFAFEDAFTRVGTVKDVTELPL